MVELVLLVVIGGRIGGLATFAWLAGGVVVGGVLARREGRRALRAWQQASVTGEVPGGELGESAAVVVAGALLMLPGVLSDVVALLLLLPPVRRALADRVRRRIGTGLAAHVGGLGAATGPGGVQGLGRILDLDPGDVREVDPPVESR